MRNTITASVEEAQKRVHQVSLLLPLSSISDSWLRLSVLGSLPAPYLVDSVPASFFLVVYHTSMSWCRKKDEHSVLLCSTVLLRIRVGRASKGSLLAKQRGIYFYTLLWHRLGTSSKVPFAYFLLCGNPQKCEWKQEKKLYVQCSNVRHSLIFWWS